MKAHRPLAKSPSLHFLPKVISSSAPPPPPHSTSLQPHQPLPSFQEYSSLRAFAQAACSSFLEFSSLHPVANSLLTYKSAQMLPSPWGIPWPLNSRSHTTFHTYAPSPPLHSLFYSTNHHFSCCMYNWLNLFTMYLPYSIRMYALGAEHLIDAVHCCIPALTVMLADLVLL